MDTVRMDPMHTGEMTMYLIRHCETGGNAGGRFQGRSDTDISKTGQHQLEQLRRRFAPVPLDAVYSSPLLRARRTAEAVKGEKAIPLYIDDRLIEIDGGDWEDRPWDEFPGKFPQESADWVNRPGRFVAPHGEAMAAVYARMSQALREIAAKHPGGCVAVVSHGCAVRNALCFAKGLPLDRLQEVGWCDNTGVCELRWEIPANGTAAVRAVVRENDVSHLDAPPSVREKHAWWKGDR